MIFTDVRLVKETFSPQKVIDWVADCTVTKGGVASFTGYVSANDGVEALELSHYEPLTEPGMEDLAIEVQRRFEIKALAIVHRTGLIKTREPIVCVAAASRHRRDAIETVDFCMDHLKSAAWFWKRELTGGEWRWIEPRDEDYRDLARWNAK